MLNRVLRGHFKHAILTLMKYTYLLRGNRKNFQKVPENAGIYRRQIAGDLTAGVQLRFRHGVVITGWIVFFPC